MPARTLPVNIDEPKIDDIFRPWDQGRLPGVAVGIAVNGRVVYRQGFGLASLELPTLLSPTIRMRVASITKHFTSLAYLLLCEDGRAAFDDGIGKYLPELHPVTHGVTVRQLLGHLSGLRDAKDIALQFSGPGRSISSDDLLSFYHNIDDVNAAPGTAWRYNNGGYLMVTAAIERITGRTLEEVLRERIFAPTGMNDTMLRRWDNDFAPNSATLHMTRSDGKFEKSYLGIASAGEGGIVSTVDDMLRWLAHMDDPIVGSAETWNTMRSPQRLPNEKSTGYSVGLITGRYRGVETLSHGGGVMGGNAHLLKVPAAGLDVIVISNRHDVLSSELANRILDACLADLHPSCLALHHQPVSGIFVSATTGRVILLCAREMQQLAVIDGYEMPMELRADGWLSPAAVCGYMRQEIKVMGDPKRPSSLLFTDFGNDDELVAAPFSEPPDARSIAGTYHSASTSTDAVISASSNGALLRTFGRFGSVVNSLEFLADGIWRATPMGVPIPSGILSFNRRGTSFKFTSPRTWALPFERSAKSPT